MVWAPVYCPRLIGRRHELEALGERLREACAGHGSLVLLAGEAGIGKSRLAAEFCARVRVAEAHTALAHCYDYAPEPLAPIRALLEALGHEWRLQGAGRLELLDALLDGLRDLVRRKPAALVIEDIQWADALTLAFLQHLAQSIAGMRLLVVCSYRSEDLPAQRNLQTTLARLERLPVVWRIVLGPLSDEEIDELIELTVEERYDVPPDVRARIRVLAEGNPLFAEELVKSAVDRPPGETTPLPLSISHAVRDRLARLRVGERRLLECAAAMGREVEARLLARVAKERVDDVERTLQRAAALQLMLAPAGPDAPWRFRHAVVRQAIYDELSPAKRRDLHARIAQVLDASPDAANRVAALAYHYAQAGVRDRAAHYNRLAGDAANAIYAFDEAVECYERALEASECASALERGELYERLAQCLYSLGLGERARRAWENAISAYEAAGDVERVAQARVDYGRFCYNLGATDEAIAQAQRALQVLESKPESPVHFTARVSLAGHYATLGNPTRTLEHLDAAARLTVPRRRKDEQLFHEYRGGAFAHLDDPVRCTEEFHKAIAIALEIGNVVGAARLLSNHGVRMAEFGDPAQATDAFEKALAIFEEHRIGGTVPATCLLQYALACERVGYLEKARALLERCRVRRVDTTRFALYAAACGIVVGLALEDDELVQRSANPALIEEAFTSALALTPVIVTPFVRLHLHHGQRTEALALLRRGWAAACAHDPSLLQHLEWLCVLVAAHLDMADVAQAQLMLERRLEQAPQRAVQAHHALVTAWRAKRERNATLARESAQRAADMFAALHWPYRQAQALELAGRRRAALDVYRSFGDRADERRLEASLRPTNAPGWGASALTPREHEIARLVAEGKSNRQIAEQLVIGERTVESHVASILQKLGASTRVEIAVRLLRDAQNRDRRQRLTPY
jgi:DNA-binding CsgD family transcriptional regulator